MADIVEAPDEPGPAHLARRLYLARRGGDVPGIERDQPREGLAPRRRRAAGGIAGRREGGRHAAYRMASHAARLSRGRGNGSECPWA
jgi:hypothetical protein